ncbi:unnamed protein product [Lactuca saligna]|uniref:Uncharacterized protein n=1 Tax=Lactuca saligna TaxID=75948 RepID=A0AA36EMW1_LACSI|nr:unnamed protein product [Lactuca saligna]
MQDRSEPQQHEEVKMTPIEMDTTQNDMQDTSNDVESSNVEDFRGCSYYPCSAEKGLTNFRDFEEDKENKVRENLEAEIRKGNWWC